MNESLPGLSLRSLQPVAAGLAVDFPARRRRALAAAREVDESVAALVLHDAQDIHYLTGTREGISWLVVADAGTFAVSRHMLVDEVRAEAVDCEVLLASARSTDQPDLAAFVIGALAGRGLSVVAADPCRFPAQAYLLLRERAAAGGVGLRALPDLFAGLRAVKDAAELSRTRRCVEIAETAFAGLLDGGAAGLVGRSERELAIELEARMRALGADRQAFPGTGIIVASGPNSAKPHHAPGARRVVAGEALLFDWGAELDGYRSDLTRTVFPGGVAEFARDAYPVVELALARAAGLLAAGVAMGEIDGIARETVMAAGYPEFHYGVGHGVGLAIHEAPWLRAGSTVPCAEDMLTTLEPGIYLPGIGGIRIECLYRVTREGAECLGRLPTDLPSMVLD